MQALRPVRKSLFATLGIVIGAQALLMACMVATAALLTPDTSTVAETAPRDASEHVHAEVCESTGSASSVGDFRGLVLF